MSLIQVALQKQCTGRKRGEKAANKIECHACDVGKIRLGRQ